MYIKSKFASIVQLLFGMVCLLAANPVLSQITNPVNDIKFQQLSAGLSQNTVTCILQDSKGFMWFGTRNGLNRYDGVAFTTYTNIYGDSTSLSHSHVNCMFEDSDGNLWIGTWEGGLNLYDRDRDIFIQFKQEEGSNSINDNAIYAIYEDIKHNLWIGTENGGLNYFDRVNNVFKHYTHDPLDSSSISDNHVRIIFEDSLQQLWVGTCGGGLNKFDQESKTFSHFIHDENNPKSLGDDVVWKHLTDAKGRIWLGTKGGLNLMKEENGEVTFERFQHEIHNENSLGHNTVLSLEEYDYGRLWVGTENGGLSVFDYEKGRFTNFFPDPLDPVSIGSNSIWSIYKDKSGAMWVGARNRGLNKWDLYQRKFNHRMISPSGDNSLSNKDVMCFLEDNDGDLWIGTDGGGLNFYDKETKKYTHFIHDPHNDNSIGSNSVTSIMQDSQGRIWVGTWEGGLNMFDKKTNTFKHYLHNTNDSGSLQTNHVFTMLEDRNGRLWFGAFYGGLDLYQEETDSFLHFSHIPENDQSLSHNRVFNLFEDSNGNIWVGTEGGGVSVFSYENNAKPTFKRYQFDPNDSLSLSSNVIHAITEDRKGTIWIGTISGLNKYDAQTDTFKSYREKDGLPDNVVNGMLEDDDGFLWISTNQGMTKFDPVLETFRNYNAADGLQAQEFIRGSFMRSESGELFFGGVNGFNSFHPNNVKDNPYIPSIYITGFKIDDDLVKPGQENSPLTKHISETKEITLSYSQNDFSFEFAALNYSQASKNRYSYKLEGYDRDWHYVGTQRNANYGKVPHGSYTFKVRGSNNDGIWNQEGAALHITITPPWWDTWWAYALYLCVLIGLFLWYRQNLINRERLRSDLKLEHLELTKMQELDEMKSYFYANISHEFRTPLTLILSPLKLMSSGNFKGDEKKQYQVMIRNGERLLRLINQLLDLSKLGSGNMKIKARRQNIVQFLKPIVASFDSYSEKKDISYKFNYPGFPVNVYFDSDKIEKIITNLIYNAFKFTDKGEISVTVKTDTGNDGNYDKFLSGFVEISVCDTGAGIPDNAINYIFDRFYQADQTQCRKSEGTGIGLSLAKDLVELHHGTITVKSIKDQGSEFKVLLPLGKKHFAATDLVDVDAVKDNAIREITPSFNVVSDELDNLEESIASTELDESMPHVLVVEDNTDMRAYIKENLSQIFHIIEAKDGKEGLEKSIEYIPDLIISDVMMPEMNGVEMCKNVKEDQRICHIPLILLTAKADVENKLIGLSTGADDYITKPFDARILAVRARNLVNSRIILRDKFSTSKTISIEPNEIAVTPLDEVFINNVLKIIEKNMSNSDFRVEDLGKEVAMSRMHLYRKIKALTGQSIVEFIRTIRLKRAAQLLKQGQLTVSEITYDVGFNDLQYFRNCFKKQFGVSPSQYANSKTIETDS